MLNVRSELPIKIKVKNIKTIDEYLFNIELSFDNCSLEKCKEITDKKIKIRINNKSNEEYNPTVKKTT